MHVPARVHQRRFASVRPGSAPIRAAGAAMVQSSRVPPTTDDYLVGKRSLPVMSSAEHLTDPREEAAFAAAVERHRAELQVHCYRMLGSFEDSRISSRRPCVPGASARASAQTAARRSGPGSTGSRRTRASMCFAAGRAEFFRRGARRPATTATSAAGRSSLAAAVSRSAARVGRPGGEGPAAVTVARETIELAFLAAIQHLPPRQRAVLLLRDVLGWSARDGLAARGERGLGQQRAAEGPSDAAGPPTRAANGLGATLGAERGGASCCDATSTLTSGPTDALAALLLEDARLTMPPHATWYAGRKRRSWSPRRRASTGLRPAAKRRNRANLQPAAAHLRPPGESQYRPLALDVLRVEGGRVAEISSFVFPGLSGIRPSADALSIRAMSFLADLVLDGIQPIR